MDGSALIRTESVNEPRCGIALEQSEGCLQATTETTWHVMLVLLQLRELLRKDPEKYDYSVYWMLDGNRVAVNGANAIVVGPSRTTPSDDSFIAAGTRRFRANLRCFAPNKNRNGAATCH